VTRRPDTWIRLDAVEVRRARRWMAGLSAGFVLAALAFLALPAERTQESASLPDRFWAVAVFAVPWLVMLLAMLNARHGRTLLTEEGMRFHTWLSRRFIPWREITAIEAHTHRGWHHIRVHRANGRRRTVPGIFTDEAADESFHEKLRTIQRYWQAASLTARGTSAPPDPAA
jgi:hypothetical protein